MISQSRIEQIGSPQELYQRPATDDVADFMASRTRTSGCTTCVDGEEAEIDVNSARMPVAPDNCGGTFDPLGRSCCRHTSEGIHGIFAKNGTLRPRLFWSGTQRRRGSGARQRNPAASRLPASPCFSRGGGRSA
jgi:hypothetical protein